MTTNNDSTVTETTKTLSPIDKAIAAAKAKAAARAAAGLKDSAKPEVGEKKEPKAKKTAAEQLAEKAAKDKERAEKKTARDLERAAKKAKKEAVVEEVKKGAHMGKVVKALESLPAMDNDVQSAFELVCGAGLNEGQIAILLAHLSNHNRAAQTVHSRETKLVEGQRVKVIGSDRDARLIGKVGHITQVRKIRCLVQLDDMAKESYLFLADVVPFTDEPVAPPVVEKEEEDEEVTTSDEAVPVADEEGFIKADDETSDAAE